MSSIRISVNKTSSRMNNKPHIRNANHNPDTSYRWTELFLSWNPFTYKPRETHLLLSTLPRNFTSSSIRVHSMLVRRTFDNPSPATAGRPPVISGAM